MAAYLIDPLDVALARYGTYTYGDKGAHEVLDVEALVAQLLKRDAEQVLADMASLGRHEHGAVLYDDLFAGLVEDGRHPDADVLYERLPAYPDGPTLADRTQNPQPVVTAVHDVHSALGL